MTIKDKEIKAVVHEAMMSKTYQAIATICGNVPVDVTKPDELKTALATTMREVVSSIDNGEIIFKTNNAEAFTLTLLSIALKQVVGSENIIETILQ